LLETCTKGGNQDMNRRTQNPSGVRIITSSKTQPKKKKSTGGCGCGKNRQSK